MKKNDDQVLPVPTFEQTAKDACLAHLDFCRACAPMKETLIVEGDRLVRSTTFDLCRIGKFLSGLVTAGEKK